MMLGGRGDGELLPHRPGNASGPDARRGLEGGDEKPLRILGGFLATPPPEYGAAATRAAKQDAERALTRETHEAKNVANGVQNCQMKLECEV